MPTTGAIPWANDISSTQEGDGSNTGTASPSRTTWIGFIVFGICAVALAIVIVMLFLRRNHAVAVRSDPESLTRGRRNHCSNSHRTSSRSPAVVELGRTYKQFRGDDAVDTKIPATQRGQSVECVICLEPFRDQSLVRALPCHHLFHAECIARWFRKHHDTCPICMARDDSVSGSGSGGSALPEPPPPAFLAF